MELWEKIRARSLGSSDRWSSWISCLSLCDSGCTGHFVCSNATMEDGWERNLCFPTRFKKKKKKKITSQWCPVWADLSWWQIEMLINDRVERGAKSPSHCYDAVCLVVTETANQQRGEGGEENKKMQKRLSCVWAFSGGVAFESES